jgi:hypothetical protein
VCSATRRALSSHLHAATTSPNGPHSDGFGTLGLTAAEAGTAVCSHKLTNLHAATSAVPLEVSKSMSAPISTSVRIMYASPRSTAARSDVLPVRVVWLGFAPHSSSAWEHCHPPCVNSPAAC